MIWLIIVLVLVPLLLLAETGLIALVGTGIAWHLALLAAAAVFLLLFRILLVALKPATIAATFMFFALVAAIGGMYGLVAYQLTKGIVALDDNVDDLLELIDRSRAIEIIDQDNRTIGILPANLDPDRQDSPYLAIHLHPDDVPPVFWACTLYLEDRSYGEFWHIYGIDFQRIARAVTSILPGWLLKQGRKGGSTVAEMVDRSLRNARPRVHASFLSEFGRKMVSWQNMPAVAKLFPTEEALKAAAATHLPLMIGGEGSRWGPDIHGIGLAAAVLGKSVKELNVAEQAVLAAAINLPLRIGSPDVDRNGGSTWAKARQRADRCLNELPLGEGVDRAQARKQLAEIVPPQPPRRHPAIEIRARMNGRAPMIVRETARVVGSDWPQRVSRIRMSTQQLASGLTDSMREAAFEAERRAAGKFAVPIWSGSNSALVFGTIVNSSGESIVAVSNSDIDVGSTKLPIGSIGKIAAAFALAEHSPPSALTLSTFAHSNSRRVAALLRRTSDVRVAQIFSALNWSRPSNQSARRHAAYGAVEVAPVDVLRATIAINDLLWQNRTKPVVLSGAIDEIELVDGSRLSARSAPLSTEPIARILTPLVRTRAARLLGAPLGRGGTMHLVGEALRKEGATELWGKSGTADVGAGGFRKSQTRALWHAAGFNIGGERFTLLLVVASRDSRTPLGFVTSPAITPMTLALLRQGIRKIRKQVANPVLQKEVRIR